jgi:hypothetical protein
MINSNCSFIANRSDGLGNRLIALVNSIVLGKKFGARFFFNWPEDKVASLQHHSIVGAELIFNSEFIEKYYLFDALKLSEPKDFSQLIQDSNDSKIDGSYIIDPVDLTLLNLGVTSLDYQSAFNDIKFSCEVEDVYIEANDHSHSDTLDIAIHARAGDVVYGAYRFNDRFTSMVIPYPLIEKLLHNIEVVNKNAYFKLKPYLFGQDEELKKYLKNKYPFLALCEQVRSESYLQAFYEIFLMSRCGLIFCGSSAFAKLASKKNCAKEVSLANFLEKNYFQPENREQYFDYDSLIIDSIDKLPSLQIAHASWSIFYFLKDFLEHDKQLKLLQFAVKFDKKNDFYKLVLASVFCSKKNFESAESILNKSNGKSEQGSLWQICRPSPGGVFAVKKYLSDIEAGAKNDFYMCNLVLGIYYYHCKDAAMVDFFVRRCQSLNQNAYSANLNRLISYLA